MGWVMDWELLIFTRWWQAVLFRHDTFDQRHKGKETCCYQVKEDLMKRK